MTVIRGPLNEKATLLKVGNAKHSFWLKRKSNQGPFCRKKKKSSCGLQEWVRLEHWIFTNRTSVVENGQEAMTRGLTNRSAQQRASEVMAVICFTQCGCNHRMCENTLSCSSNRSSGGCGGLEAGREPLVMGPGACMAV